MIRRGGNMKKGEAGGTHRIRRSFILSLFIVLIVGLGSLTGCLNMQRPGRNVEQYILEYPPPEISGLSFIDTAIRVERFTEAATYNASTMFYRPEPFKLESYQYHRWRVHPADLVTGYLLRDLRNAALFRAVFSYLDPEDGRFIVEGGVEEFLEVDEKNQRLAVLAIGVTLLDSWAKDIPNRVLFQKRYRFQEPIEENTPRGLAKGMSQAMKKFSETLIRDLHAATQKLKQ
jgi:ABC-type uncharacterized transport system auxiliary subunit